MWSAERTTPTDAASCDAVHAHGAPQKCSVVTAKLTLGHVPKLLPVSVTSEPPSASTSARAESGAPATVTGAPPPSTAMLATIGA